MKTLSAIGAALLACVSTQTLGSETSNRQSERDLFAKIVEIPTVKGRTAEFLRSTDITTRGAFPVNTGGGQLSAGQAGAAGGMIGVVEGVTQLLGRAGERQVRCTRGVVSGYGMVAYGRGLCSSAAILERVEQEAA